MGGRGGGGGRLREHRDQGLLQRPVLRRGGDRHAPTEVHGGLRYDASKFTGDISWISLAEPKYWLIDVEDISIGAYSSGATNGIVDSGTSLITGPGSDIEEIAASVGARRNLLGQY